MPVGNTTLTWVEQSPLVMGIAADADQVARAVKDGADIVDLGRASGGFVGEMRHTHPGVPAAVDVAGRAGAAGDIALAGAALLYDSTGSTQREVAAVAAECGAAVVCAPEQTPLLRAAGVAQLLVTPGWQQGADAVRRGVTLVDGDWPVLLTVADGDGSGVVPAECIAAATHAAMAGVRVLRTDRVTETRRTVDMIASILGTRQPARVRRALA